jgi:hypothetical protein
VAFMIGLTSVTARAQFHRDLYRPSIRQTLNVSGAHPASWVNSICATTAASAIRNASFPRGLTPIEFVSSGTFANGEAATSKPFEPYAKPHDGGEAQAIPDLSGVNRRYLGTAAKGGIFHYYSSASYLEAGRQVARGGSSIRINRKVQFCQIQDEILTPGIRSFIDRVMINGRKSEDSALAGARCRPIVAE